MKGTMKKLTIIEKLFCLILAGLIISIPLYPYVKAWALEFHADKNAAFNFTAPLINSTNTSLFAVGANNTYVYINSNDGTTFTAANTNTTRVDAGGIYLFQLNATEMNHDLIGVYYNGTGCLQQYFAINTKLKEIADSVYTALGNGTVVTTDTAKVTAINATVNHATYGNEAIKTNLGGLSNVTLNGTQAFNNTGNLLGNVTNVTNPVSLNATIAY